MGTITAYGSKHSHEFSLNVSETSYNIQNNSSEVSFSFTLYKSSYSWGTYNNIYYTVNIDGTDYNGTIPNYTAGTTLTIRSGTQTIAHNSDGSKSINYSFAVTDNSGQSYTCGNASASGTMPLTNIPRYATAYQSLSSKTSSSIKMNWSSDSIIDYVWYSIDNGYSWVGVYATDGTSGTYDINGLLANTTYNIKTKVRRKDSQLTTDSSALSITTYARTIPTISLVNKTVNSITVSSDCNVSVSSTQYRIKQSSGSYGSYQTSSTFSGLTPNTSYTIEVQKVGTASGEFGTATIIVSTYAIATITAPNFNLGDSFNVTITNPSGQAIEFFMETLNGDSREATIRVENTSAGTKIIMLSDAELDLIYKKINIGTTTTVRIGVRTISTYYDWQDRICTLTGNQKSIKINVNNEIKRGKFFVNVKGVLKKAVICTNIKNILKRGI